jgi:hypothetical protein
LEGGLEGWRRLGYPMTVAEATNDNVAVTGVSVPEAEL